MGCLFHLNNKKMQLQMVKRPQPKIRIALQGSAGSGKTYSSLLLAYGLCNDWTKIALIETEHQSAALYSNLGQYNVLNIESPFNPEKYIEAINICEKAGMQAIILDSLSHEWETLLEIHSAMSGNSYNNWNKVIPEHNSLINKILTSSSHIIATVRSKSEFVISEKDGKKIVEKFSTKPFFKEGYEFDFTLVFDIDTDHQAVCSKDRTQVFAQNMPFQIEPNTGLKIREWCLGSVSPFEGLEDPLKAKIRATVTLEELTQLYRRVEDKNKYLEAFSQRAEEIRKQFDFPFPLHSNGK
jgi:hypothetical protein